MPRIFLLIALIITFPLAYFSQTRVNSTGTGGVHTIQGQVYSPNGRILDVPITVKLQSISYTELTLITDQNGSFAFKRLAPGNYTVVVDIGDDIEVVREHVTIDPEAQGAVRIAPTPKIFTVPIFLRQRPNERQKNMVIDARLASMPKDAVRHFEKGMSFMREGKLDSAIAELKESISIYSAYPPAHVELGKTYIRMGLIDDAVGVLRNALRYDSRDFEALLNLGISLLAKKNFRDAESLFNQAAQVNPTAVTPHYYLGVMYVEEKQFDPALRAFDRAKTLSGGKGLPMIHRYLGGIYLARGQKQLAIEELQAYLKLDPNSKDGEKIRKTLSELQSNP